jgi:hypothetical protein
MSRIGEQSEAVGLPARSELDDDEEKRCQERPLKYLAAAVIVMVSVGMHELL